MKRLLPVIAALLCAFRFVADAQTNDCKPFDFNLPASYQTGPNAYSFDIADFNGDGRIDVVTPNYDHQTVSVLFGDGAGGFLPRRDFATEISVYTVTTGDLNGDGKLDLIAGASGGGKVVVLLNNAEGGFSAPTVISFPSDSYRFDSLEAADLNGDGNSDVAGVTRNNLHIFLGNGQGGLELKTTSAWKGTQNGIAVGKFNNDNLADLAITGGNFGEPFEFGIILGSSSGTFTFNNRYSLPNQPSGIVAGEFNGDGLTDVVIASNYPYQNSTPQTYTLQLWIGSENGSFTAGTKVNLPFSISEATAGDFNGDGKLDLAASIGSMVATLYGTGDGNFQNPTYWAAPSLHLTAAHINQDNRQDLLSIQVGSPNSLIFVTESAGNDGFLAPKAALGGGSKITAADFNNDGLLDMVTAVTAREIEMNTPSEIVIALNDGNKGYLPDRKFATAVALGGLAVGDFNGDGNKDIVTAHSNNGRQIAIYLGDGTGNLAAPVSRPFINRVQDVITGDFNGDGKDDIFAVEGNGGYVLLSRGNGNFAASPDFKIDLVELFVTPKTGDFNGDGKLDLVVAMQSPNITIPWTVAIWLGNGNGTFTRGGSESFAAAGLAVDDVNGDGKLDVVATSIISNTLIIRLLGDGNGGFSRKMIQPVNWRSSELITGDFNEDGIADIAMIGSGMLGNLVVIPSSKQEPFWETPVFYTVGGITYADPSYVISSLVAADFNRDNKIDIGFTSKTLSRGVIYNTSGQKPCLSINDVTVTEGETGTTTAAFTVSLSSPSAEAVRVNYTLAGQSAFLGTDLQNLSGQLVIPAGQTSGTINVNIIGDLSDEFDEEFTINLSSPRNAALAKAVGKGTIVDNDAEPSITVNDVSQSESGFSQAAVFRFSLSAPSGKPITVRLSTASGTATAGKDFPAVENTYTIQPGNAYSEIGVLIFSDNIHERDETFFLNLSEPVNAVISDAQGKATILNDDPVPIVNVLGGNAIEGDIGVPNRTINLQLSNPTYLPVTISIITSDVTALAGKDYVAFDTTVVIPAEQQSATSNAPIIGDTVNEPNETFNVNIYNPVNATISNPQSSFLIIDDEAVSNDFDRDGKTDFAVFRPSDHNWYLNFSSNGGFSAQQYGLATDIPVSGDYNNDGRTDIAVWRSSTGGWYTTIANRSQIWGKEGDVPVPGDYDNDGRIDVAVFRPSAKTWYIQLSSNGSLKAVQFGLETDKPVPADYDGDGKTDIAVFRSSTGYWYILRSTDDVMTSLQFGIETDKPVPADYDGDGKADIAVYRDGNWYYNRSSNNAFTAFRWGIVGDKPVPGNYDGDDKTDFAVYRDGTWYIWLSSTNSLTAKQFGLPDDVPIPFVSNN
ncbi:MAG TPA: FG-GAP-like repeat-containing protein [Pyrinomonadaceae bacterium]